jgi:hypothetical protein
MILFVKTDKDARASITATDAFTLPFICTFHNRMAGMIDKLKSVRISMAEKNKLTFVFS